MKRANSQKDNQSVLLPTAVFHVELGHSKQVSPDSNRRVCTSAAMIGLAAISMGLPNLLFPEGQQAARAAEPATLDPTQTTNRASQSNLTGRGVSTTVVSPGFNAATASLGNSPVMPESEGFSRAEILSPESPFLTSQPPLIKTALEEKSLSTSELSTQEIKPEVPVILTPEFIDASDALNENQPVAQQQKEQEQAALDEAVSYVAVLESVNPESSRTLTVLPSGKTAPKFPSLPAPVEESPVTSESVIVTLPKETKAEEVTAVKPSWQQMQSETEGVGPVNSTWTVKPITESQVDATPKKITLEVYQVQSGDTVNTIAKTHGVDSSALIEANQLSNPDQLEVDQSLAVTRFENSTSGISSAAVAPSLPWKVEENLQPVPEFDGTPKLFTPSPEIASTETLANPTLKAETETGVAPELQETTPLVEPTHTEVEELSGQPKEQLKEMSGSEPELPSLTIAPSLNSTSVASRFSPRDSVFPQPVLHQVRRGETLDSIARRYGVTRSELIRVNHITNPNLIQVNQNLKIPKSQSLDSITATPAIPGINTTEISSAAIDSQQPVPLVSFNNDSSSQKQSTPNPTEESAYSTYVEGLTTELNQLRQQYQNQPASVTLPLTQPLTPVQQPVTSVARPVERVNSEFSTSSSTGNLEEDLRRLQEKYRSSSPSTPQTPASGAGQNVAVAPLGPDAYDPSKLPIGEMVSPEVPPLAPSERYLPGDRMNGYIWPAQGVFTSGYGWRWGRMHRGIDIAGPIGTPIFAAAPGVVDYSDWNSGGYGYLVDIRHPDGSLTRYAHNNRLLVRKGQKVRQGQQIAEMGSTGYSTGPHLHFEIHPAGQGAVNPMAYLPNR
ncbi:MULTISPECIES: peptidoglycan DD-metalloendopeptidase family protein [unclassified Roseofilum]|uniref:peptidoglycan DD-metalloendopeptidase family protein n=1 Tax=unclassified Roseofilum TaxID=2620099 RepID=UPI001B03B5A9|nr:MULTISPECIES: peptidoglycan DD-metalloendopeptidase family protein [unclassified Roseofilum]MBP0007300.1 peptidoglycan DD-metalloendopeptidase family protein [Roseofilum sp. Belize Diploria]MBP0032510.1 peptidoglycan DD-metalloendopeptidase family protein [Roseofilum sp. Belize BBD 4]